MKEVKQRASPPELSMRIHPTSIQFSYETEVDMKEGE